MVRGDKGGRGKRSIGRWVRETPDSFALIRIVNPRSGRETYAVPTTLSSGMFIIAL